MNPKLISAYIKFAESEEDSAEYESSFWAYDELSTMCSTQPLEAWKTIASVLSHNPSSRVLELLAAGPLENLLVSHGSAVIDEIESSAKLDPRVAMLLGGVWRSEIDEGVWNRIERARARKW